MRPIPRLPFRVPGNNPQFNAPLPPTAYRCAALKLAAANRRGSALRPSGWDPRQSFAKVIRQTGGNLQVIARQRRTIGVRAALVKHYIVGAGTPQEPAK